MREKVAELNPKFSAIVDELNPGSKYTLFKVSYPFGSEILKNGYLHLPDETGRLISIYDSRIKPHIQEALNYNLGSNPVSFILKNSAEIFTNLEHRIIPLYGLIPSGKLFGLWCILTPTISHNPTFLWGMTAGARSLIMLPKIAKTISHKRLQQKLHIHTDVPRNLLDQWQVFRDISQSLPSKEPWITEILFFSNEWFKSLCNLCCFLVLQKAVPFIIHCNIQQLSSFRQNPVCYPVK